MKKLVSIFSVAALSLVMTACGENKPENVTENKPSTTTTESKSNEVATPTPNQVAVSKATYTVDELYQNKELRKQILEKCFGKTMSEDPNCEVALIAEEKYAKEFNSPEGKKVQKWN